MSRYNETAYPFRPVRCTEDKLATLDTHDGYLYFTTDTQKVFLGNGTEKLEMCSSKGFYYGKKLIEYVNDGKEPDPIVQFIFNKDELISEIEGQSIPELDDLILNIGTETIPDGCFYRVKNISIDENDNNIAILTTTRLTLQGSSGGAGGSGGGGSTATNFTISIVGNTKKIFSSQTNSMPIEFRCNYVGEAENYIRSVAFKFSGATEAFYEIENSEDILFNQINTVDLIDYINLFNYTRKTVIVEVTDAWDTVRSTNFSIQLLTLSLTTEQDDILSSVLNNGKNELKYVCTLSGSADEIKSKTLYYNFYKEDNLTTPYKTIEKILNTSTQGEITEVLNLTNFEHGGYILKIKCIAELKSSATSILSNELIHKVGVYTSAGNNPILIVKLPQTAEMHKNIPVMYQLISPENNAKYTMQIKIDGQEETQLSITTNKNETYDFYFEDKITKQYTLFFAILELNIEYQEILTVTPYTGIIPVIDPTRADLMFYLNPRKKSNNEITKNIWYDYNNKKNDNNEILSAELKNFHFGAVNGWQKDIDGSNYLSLTSGASLRSNNFTPFAEDLADQYGMTIELDFEINGVLDYNTKLIKCISTDDSGTITVGFDVTGNKINFYNSRLNGGEKGALMSLNLIEGKRVRASFVIERRYKNNTFWYPMCYTYLNGIMSSAVLYQEDDKFIDDNNINPANLIIDSTDANIKIYGIRFYNIALSHREILNNYIASFTSLTDKENVYNTNDVFSIGTGKIDLNKVLSEDYDLQIPIMKITGGWSTLKDSKWELKDQKNANVGLPTGKKDYRLIDIEVKYPKNEYFKNYNDYSFKNEFKSGKPMSEAYGEKPSNGGCIMYAQGTSSMEYPVKNLRIRFKKDENFFKVKPNIEAVEIICMKADYMESSGSHNTGTGNLVDDLYAGMSMQTPGQKEFNSSDKNIVTCIKGHPCLIFYSPTGETNTYEYIGKYNLNLDKATPEPFGFKNDENFGYLPINYEYYNELPLYKEDENGDLKYIGENANSAKQEKVEKNGTVNAIHCFEFLDNAVEVCNFINKKGESNYYDTWYKTFTNKDNEQVPGWTLGFESRYPEDKVGYHDADSLYQVAFWIHSLYDQYLKEITKEDGTTLSREEILEKEYTYNYKAIIEDIDKDKFDINAQVQYYILIEDNEDDAQDKYQEAYPTSREDFDIQTYYIRTLIDEKFKLNSLETFKRQYECYFNKDFLLTYYLLTEALLMADSRVKNMMIATWGPEERIYYANDDRQKENPIKTNNYIWYPIFYDMDTMMGLDNTGVYRFNYFDEDLDTTLFNGDEALWILVRDALQNELKIHYTRMEESLLTVGKNEQGKDIGILPYYNNNQANMANEAFYNGDADYKYINPARNGYRDDLNGKDIGPGVGPYLYAAQGDRSLMREWFITNRIKYLQGKYNSGKFKTGDRIDFRWYYPKNNDLVVQPNDTFEFTALKTGYAGVLLGANGNVYSEKFSQAGDKKNITLPEAAGANGTEAYILGVSNLTDLGDLSDKYVQKFVVASDDVRLEKLILGNGKKGYDNIYLGSSVGGQSPTIDIKKCTQLKEFNLYNCKSYNSVLDFSASKGIEKIYLTGSGVTGITLPINGVINELRLPNTITALRINSHSSLTQDNFSLGTYDYGENSNIIGDGQGTFVNDYSKLKYLNIINTNIDSYTMACKAIDLSAYCLQNINWEITSNDTQYCRVERNNFNETETYYIRNNNEFNLYEGNTYPENAILYKQYTMLDESNKIICIPILERLKDLKLDDSTNTLTQAEALTGKIFINIENSSVTELQIYEKYHELYPNLTFEYGSKVNVEGAKKIEFYRVDKNDLKDMGSINDLQPYFIALTDGEKTLGELINSTAFSNPSKSSTSYYEYHFTGKWYDSISQRDYYQNEIYTESGEENYWFNIFKPKENMRLIPYFDEVDRQYRIDFYNEGYPEVVDLIFSINGTYNQTIEKALENDVNGNEAKGYFNYIEKSDLEDTERYTFKGWIKENDLDSGNMTELSKIYITGNQKLIAKYKYESVSVASDTRYFDIVNNAISINEKYRKVLVGKITLPLQYNSQNILTINDFKNTLISKIYFEDGNNNYSSVASGAFANQINLISIDLPASITIIGDGAFQNCSNLENIGNYQNIEKIEGPAFQNCIKLSMDLKEMPNLNTIGGSAFGHIDGIANNITASELPKKLTELNVYAFKNCPNINITDFTQLTKMGDSSGFPCLSGCGNGVTSITIKSEGITYGKNAFQDYALNATILNVVGTLDDAELRNIGLGRNWNTSEQATE